MRHLVKVIYDISNNRKVTVEVSPGTFGADDQLTQKFFPADTSEMYFYSSVPIVDDPDEWSDVSRYYYWKTKPSGQVYSLLKSEVEVGPNPLADIDPIEDVISGIIPVLETAYYSAPDLKNFGFRYGLIYKNSIYENQMDQLSTEMLSDIQAGEEWVVSINKQRSLEDYIFVVRGKVLQEKTSYNFSDDGVSITGTKYHSPNLYNIDYYNDTIIPTLTKSTANQENGRLLVTGGFIGSTPEVGEVDLLTQSVTEDKFTYEYEGIDPLISEHHSKITKTMPLGINQNDFRIIVQVSNKSSVSAVHIVNYVGTAGGPQGGPNDSGNGQVAVSNRYTSYGYTKQSVGNVSFYKMRTKVNYNIESCIQASYAGMTFTYPCSKGMGSFEQLHRALAMGKMSALNKLFESNPNIIGLDTGETSSYEISLGGRLWNLAEIIEITHDAGNSTGVGKLGDLGCYDITSWVNATVNEVTTNKIHSTHTPNGRNRSVINQVSTKVTPIGIDVDEKTVLGGGIQLKTEVHPDSVVKIVLGESGLIKNINVEGTFATVGELEIVAENFYENNKSLNTITITTKGYIDPSQDLGSLLNVDDYVIDKVTYDYASNGTIIVCKAIID